MRSKTWLRVKPVQPLPPAGLVVCFPHAGGNASAYADWPAVIGVGFRVAAVRFPGRFERIAEEPCTSIAEAADAVAGEIAMIAPDRLALFGHSMGALTAFETARSLRRFGYQTPELLVLSAPVAPGSQADGIFARMGRHSDQELLDLCAALGADEMYRLASDPEKREFVLKPLREDLESVARYSVADEEPLKVDARVLVGSADSSIAPDLVPRWRKLLTGEFEVRAYVGDHFFLRAVRAAVLEDLARDLATRRGEGDREG